jgi:type I restriction enzyme M protein
MQTFFCGAMQFLAEVDAMTESDSIKEIYTDASTSLRKPVNFNTGAGHRQTDWYEENDHLMSWVILREFTGEKMQRKKVVRALHY